MPRMKLNGADTWAKLTTPALHRRNWMEDLIRREERAAPIDIAVTVEFSTLSDIFSTPFGKLAERLDGINRQLRMQ